MSENERATPAAADVWEAKLAIMEEVGYIHKTGRMKSGNRDLYSFASDQDLLKALRPVMVRHKVTLTRREIKFLDSGTYPTRAGEAQRVRYVAVWEFCHVPSKTKDVIEVLAEAGDNGDKCGPKANTCSLKYALIDYFQLPRGDAKEDPDAEIPEGQARRSPGFEACRDTIRTAPDLSTLERFRKAMYERNYSEADLAELNVVWEEVYRELARKGITNARSLDHLEKFRASFQAKRLSAAASKELNALYQEKFNSLGGRRQTPA